MTSETPARAPAKKELKMQAKLKKLEKKAEMKLQKLKPKSEVKIKKAEFKAQVREAKTEGKRGKMRLALFIPGIILLIFGIGLTVLGATEYIANENYANSSSGQFYSLDPNIASAIANAVSQDIVAMTLGAILLVVGIVLTILGARRRI